MTTPFGCFDCGSPEHWAENCPERTPARTRKEHEARIAKYVRWFRDEEPPRITLHQKRKLIEAENAREKAREKEKAK